MPIYTRDLEYLNFFEYQQFSTPDLVKIIGKPLHLYHLRYHCYFMLSFFKLFFICYETSLWTPRYGVDLVWRRQSMQMCRKRRVIFLADIASGLLDNRRHRNPGLLLQLLMMMADQAAISRVL